jgi:hypothetical protein
VKVAKLQVRLLAASNKENFGLVATRLSVLFVFSLLPPGGSMGPPLASSVITRWNTKTVKAELGVIKAFLRRL